MPDFTLKLSLPSKEIQFKTYLSADEESDRFFSTPFREEELAMSLNKCNNCSSGMDNIHFLMIKMHPEEAKTYLLAINNYFVVSEMFP